MAITYVAAGTLDSGDAPTSLAPGLPAGIANDDLLILLAGSAGNSTIGTPADYTAIQNSSTSGTGSILVAYHTVVGGESAPTVTLTSIAHAAGARIVAFRGVDTTTPVPSWGTLSRNSTQNISCVVTTGLPAPTEDNCAIVVVGLKQLGWTSVEPPVGEGTWTEAFENSVSSTNLDLGLTVAYSIQTTATALTGKSFTVTGGGSDGTIGMPVVLKPDPGFVPEEPSLTAVKHRASGTFTLKPVKYRSGGLWFTKDVVVPPPPPPPPPPPEYDLTVTIDGDGTGEVSAPGQIATVEDDFVGTYLASDIAQLTAVPSADSIFDGWTGDITSSDNPVDVLIDEDKAITATFSETPEVTHTLTVSKAGAGTGEISAPGQILTPADSVGTYVEDTTAQLSAHPDEGMLFDGWSDDITSDDNPVDVVMDADKTVTGTFIVDPDPPDPDPVDYTLTVAKAGDGTGEITSPGQILTSWNDYVGTYEAGTWAAVTAWPSPDMTFDGWTGAYTGTANPVSINMTQNKTLTATFTEVEPPPPPPPPPPPGGDVGKAASELFLWGGPNPSNPVLPQGTGWNLADLRELYSWGYRWLFVNVRRLRGFGGHSINGQGQRFQPSPAPDTDAWRHQRAIEANVSGNMNIVDYWHSLGTSADPAKILIAYDTPNAVCSHNPPMGDWFDTLNWTNTGGTGYLDVLNDLASFAAWIGFDGLITDWEMFDFWFAPTAGRDPNQPAGQSPNYRPGGWKVSRAWWPNYGDHPNWPGEKNTTYQTHSMAATQAKAKQRGSEYMKAIVDGGLTDVIVYNCWNEDSGGAIQGRINRDPTQVTVGNVKGENLDGVPWMQWDFWKGMATRQGYTRLGITNATYQKSPGWSQGATDAAKWGNAYKYEINNVMADLSQDLTSDEWYYAHSRVKWMPMSMLDAVENHSFFVYKSEAYVATQLDQMHNWSMGKMFCNFDFSGYNASHLKTSPHDYRSAMIAAGTPEIVDSQSPDLTITVGASSIIGTATDNYAITAIRWRDSTGKTGAAEHTFQILSDSSTLDAYPMCNITTWRVNWSIPLSSLAPAATTVTITAVDSHMRTTSETVDV